MMRAHLQKPDRRYFLWSLASLGFARKSQASEKRSAQGYRFLTPVGEVRMSVQYFASSSVNSFRFRDELTNRTFCLSASGDQNQGCLERFAGSMAIAHYQFRSRLRSAAPFNLRERVLTIDHDNRILPRAQIQRRRGAKP